MAEVPSTWLIELSTERCAELLRTTPLGRLGLVVDGRPTVFPVCHVFLDGMVAFPTNSGTKLHAALEWPYVAFEIDGLSPDASSGWSVMVAGQAEEVLDRQTLERLRAARRAPWRTDESSRWIRIVRSTITGRQIAGPAGS